MQLPLELQQAIESLAKNHSLKSLVGARESVSSDYRAEKTSMTAFQDEKQLLSYLITRMPATFAACCKVFQELQTRLPHFAIDSLLDLGSGPGSASWAGLMCFKTLQRLYLVEREKMAIDVGRQLFQLIHSHIEWTHASLESAFSVPAVSLAVFSYVLAEMNVEDGWAAVLRVWNSATPLIALIEPGTPRGYQRMIEMRARAIAIGAKVLAPCPHHLPCPLKGNDWCHFAARVERGKLHRQLKGGALGFEDEKFSYVILVKPNIYVEPFGARILRRPIKASGFVKLELCKGEGVIEQHVITRSDKQNYRAARDAAWGDPWM